MNHKTEELVVQARHWAATKSAYRHLFTDLADAIEAESARADGAELAVEALKAHQYDIIAAAVKGYLTMYGLPAPSVPDDEREALSRILIRVSREYHGEHGASIDEVDGPLLADAILAAGYRRPQPEEDRARLRKAVVDVLDKRFVWTVDWSHEATLIADRYFGQSSSQLDTEGT